MRFCLYVVLGAILGSTAALAEGASRVVPVVRADPRSGQLIRTIVIAPRVVESRVVPSQAAGTEIGKSPAVVSSEVRELVEAAAKAYDVSPALVHSVIQVESNYNPHAVSPKGAQGLMQLMPGTARRFGVRNSFDPQQNIEGGVRYLKFLRETFKDDRLAIAAYNAGEGAVSKYGNVPPYAETMSYVAKVGKKYGQARRAAEASQRAAQPKAGESPKAPEYRRLAQFVDAQGRVYLSTQ